MTATTPETARRAPGSRLPLRCTLGAQPLGLLLALPYLLFFAAVMAWPLIQALWISFHDLFLPAPAAVVDHPFVGLENCVSAVTDPQVRQSLANIAVFLVINDPLTAVLSL